MLHSMNADREPSMRQHDSTEDSKIISMASMTLVSQGKLLIQTNLSLHQGCTEVEYGGGGEGNALPPCIFVFDISVYVAIKK